MSIASLSETLSARWLRRLLRAGPLILTAWALVLIVAGAVYVTRFEIDNAVGIWFLADDPERAVLERSNRTFGATEWTFALVETADVQDAGFLAELGEAVARIEALEHVERVVAIANARDSGLDAEDTLVYREILDVAGGRATPAEIEAFTARLHDNPIFAANLYQHGDRVHTALMIQNASLLEEARPYRLALVERIRAILGSYPSIRGAALAGTTVINAELNRAAARDMLRYYLLIGAFLVVCGWLVLAHGRDLTVLLAVVAGTVVPTLGTAAALGLQFNMITIMLPTVLVAMGVSAVVHLIGDFHHECRTLPADRALAETLSALWRPAFWTALTTTVGFLSLSLSEVIPVRQMGLLAALGILLAWLGTFVIAPVLLHWLWADGRVDCLRRLGSWPGGWISGFSPTDSVGCCAGFVGLKSDLQSDLQATMPSARGGVTSQSAVKPRDDGEEESALKVHGIEARTRTGQDPTCRSGPRETSPGDRLVGLALQVAMRHPRRILAACALVPLALLGLLRLEADTDYVRFFRADSTLRADYERIAATDFAQYYVSVQIGYPQGRVYTDQPGFAAVQAFSRVLEQEPEVRKVLSAAQLLREADRALSGGRAPEAAFDVSSSRKLAQLLLLTEAGGNDDLTDLVTGDGARTQLLVLTDYLSTAELTGFRARIELLGARLLPRQLTLSVTGTNVLWANMDANVVDTQIVSLGVTLAVVALLLPLVLGSAWLGLLGLLLSLLPIAVTLGLMGWLGVQVNVATCLIGGIALGVAVDDSIYLLSRVQWERRRGVPLGAAVARGVRVTGSAMVATSLILVGGFATMAGSDFLPSAHFGLLFAVAVLLALAADLLLLPAVLLGLAKGGWEHTVTHISARKIYLSRRHGGTEKKMF